MARHLWLEDIELRAAIRAAKDESPSATIDDLRRRFGVSGNIVNAALEKTVDEWHAMLGTAMPRVKHKSEPPSSMHVAPISQAVAMPDKLARGLVSWEYRTVVMRGRAVLGGIVYEQQGKDGGDWKPLATNSFDQALGMLDNDGWELTSMAVLKHGETAFTGMYELVLKRPRG